MISKKELVAKHIAQLESELKIIEESLKSAHEAATHEESKAEDSHDTRGLEASYLAGAQDSRAHLIRQHITHFKNLELKTYDEKTEAGVSALLEVDCDGRSMRYFLVPFSGGAVIEDAGVSVHLLSVSSPIGEEMIGRKVGETFEVELKGKSKTYRILKMT